MLVVADVVAVATFYLDLLLAVADDVAVVATLVPVAAIATVTGRLQNCLG